jgi:hypothetical protein
MVNVVAPVVVLVAVGVNGTGAAIDAGEGVAPIEATVSVTL